MVAELIKVDKTYAGEVPTRVLFEVNLTVAPGEFLAIQGTSGSGKSTLLNLLGLLDSPTGGVLRLGDRDTAGFTARQRAEYRRDYLGFIFQFHYLLPEFTVLENALMPCRLKGREAEQAARARVQALLEQVGLGERLHYRPSQLSGGQQQRVAIIRSLANDPVLVLADEPTGNLDSKTARGAYDLMRELSRTSGKSFVMVSHDERFTRMADRVVQLLDGRVQQA
ncbi:ABC transporter ATP-binding protein [bacterium CPR1]|nr:ABC transporter ATP-binding protein [bacterium CPR1]